MMEKEMEFANVVEKVDLEKDTLKKLVGVRKVKEKELETIAENYKKYQKKFEELKGTEQDFRVRLQSLDENKKVKTSECERINDECARLKKERELMNNEMNASQKRLTEVKNEIAMCDSRVKDKSAYLMSQDKEVQRTFRFIHEENIKLERLRDEINKLVHDKKAYRNENSIIKTNIELAKEEYEKVSSEIASLKANKNKLVAAAFVKEVKDVYYLRKDNDLLKKKIVQMKESKGKKAVNE
jgi:chromosome segregation protein